MKFNIDSFVWRAVVLASVNAVIVGILLLFNAGGRADYSILYGTLISMVLSIAIEGYFAFKHERRFSPSELLGAGWLGTLVVSMIFCFLFMSKM